MGILIRIVKKSILNIGIICCIIGFIIGIKYNEWLLVEGGILFLTLIYFIDMLIRTNKRLNKKKGW